MIRFSTHASDISSCVAFQLTLLHASVHRAAT